MHNYKSCFAFFLHGAQERVDDTELETSYTAFFCNNDDFSFDQDHVQS